MMGRVKVGCGMLLPRHDSTEYGRSLAWVHGLKMRVLVVVLGNFY